jgi:hypothetical protein
MNLGEVKEWILVGTSALTLVSIAIGAVSVAISSWKALKEYRLKLEAEARAANSEKAETDVRLLKAFTELMDLANGRGGYIVSEKAIEELFKHEVFTKADWGDFASGKKKIGEFPVIYLPVGSAAQDAAIAAIATLGERHEVLKEAAIQALESAKVFKKEMAEKHLQRISRA